MLLARIFYLALAVAAVVSICGIAFNDPVPGWVSVLACFVCGTAAGQFGLMAFDKD